ncbi:MAG: protein phosphatase 2C domain-containing protein [Myxococcota bacterium]
MNEGIESTEARPRIFPAGMAIGLHLTIERLLSMGSGRTYYLANNEKPRWYTHICWGCGNKHNPASAPICEYCHRPITKRRFLLSCRWHDRGAEEFHRFASERIDHFAVNSPIVLYRYREQLLAFHEIAEEALLVDEPAPLRPRTLLAGAWTLASAILELHARGFVLDRLAPEHVLVGRNGSRLWDVDIREHRGRPIHPRDPVSHDAARMLGALLLRYVPVDQAETIAFFQEAAVGGFPDIATMQRELRGFARNLQIKPSARLAAGLSSVGRKRPANEDAWGWRRIGNIDFFIVCDGMGGYAAGDVASATAVETSIRAAATLLPRTTPKPAEIQSALKEVVATANLAVQELHREVGKNTGTTIVMLAVWPDGQAWVAHIGDSRAYRLRDGTLHPLTDDHSMVAAMVEAGKLDREGARVHPRSNVLLQYLGAAGESDPDVSKADVKPGDRVLLCSDGLWGEMSEADLATHVDPQLDTRRQVRVLVNEANDRGGKDNVTAIVVTI